MCLADAQLTKCPSFVESLTEFSPPESPKKNAVPYWCDFSIFSLVRKVKNKLNSSRYYYLCFAAVITSHLLNNSSGAFAGVSVGFY